MQTLLENEVTTTQAEEPSHVFKQPAPEGPVTLPKHILPVGEHYRIADSEWWIGYARAAYEEVAHLQGIVIYSRTTHIFLNLEESAQAYFLLPELMRQGQVYLKRIQADTKGA